MVYYPRLAFLYVWWIKLLQVSYYASASPLFSFRCAVFRYMVCSGSVGTMFPISWNNVPDKLECCSN